MRTVAVVLAVVLVLAPALIGCAPARAAQGQLALVVAAGDPAVDVPAVQRAVDGGGTVVLRGHFDFGTVRREGAGGVTRLYAVLDHDPATPDLELTGAGNGANRYLFAALSGVRITTSVTIRGERSGDGYDTTITGGYLTFAVHEQDIEVEIEDIHFDRFLTGAVRAFAGSLSVRGCRFTNPEHATPLTTSPLHPAQPEATAILASELAWASEALRRRSGLDFIPAVPTPPGRRVVPGFFDWLNDGFDPSKEKSLGRITIVGNEIDMLGEPDGGAPASGELISGIWAAGSEPEEGRDKTLVIADNVIRDCPGAAILVRGWQGGPARVEGNRIEGRAYPELTGAQMKGIEVAPFLRLPGPTRVEGNVLIDMGGPGIQIDRAVGAVVAGNRVRMIDDAARPWNLFTYAGILMYGASESTVRDNTITGTAGYAIADYGAAPGGSAAMLTANTYSGNRIEGFVARGIAADPAHDVSAVPAADVLFHGCRGNRLLGDHGRVLSVDVGAAAPPGRPA